MYIEIFANDSFNQNDLTKVHCLSMKKIDRVCISGCMFKDINFTGHEKLGQSVDYPYGLASIEARKRDITEGYKYGIRHFDLCVSRYHLRNKYYEYILNDMKELYKYIIERDKECSVRCVLDSNICDKQGLMDIAEIVNYVNIPSICLATGYTCIDIDEQLISSSRLLKKTSLEVHVGPIYSAKQYETYIANPDISGIFFNSINNLTKFTSIT